MGSNHVRGLAVKARTCWLAIVSALTVVAPGLLRAELSPAQAEMNRPIKPFRIIGNLYYVGASDVTSYLIQTTDGLIVIDGGFAETAVQVQANIAALGFKISDVKLLLIGHAHPDHAGGLPLLQLASSARLVAIREEVVPLENSGRGTFYQGERALFASMRVDRVLSNRESIRLGGVTLTPYLTPGHTPGCTTWTTRVRDGGRSYRVVFTCQLTVPHEQSLALNGDYPQIAADFEFAFKQLRKLDCDVFLAEHGSAFNLSDKIQRLIQRPTPNPFVDRNGFRLHVEKSQRDFEKALARERSSTKNDRSHLQPFEP